MKNRSANCPKPLDNGSVRAIVTPMNTNDLTHYDNRSCVLANRDITDPAACPACVAEIKSRKPDNSLDDIIATANARTQRRIAFDLMARR